MPRTHFTRCEIYIATFFFFNYPTGNIGLFLTRLSLSQSTGVVPVCFFWDAPALIIYFSSVRAPPQSFVIEQVVGEFITFALLPNSPKWAWGRTLSAVPGTLYLAQASIHALKMVRVRTYACVCANATRVFAWLPLSCSIFWNLFIHFSPNNEIESLIPSIP